MKKEETKWINKIVEKICFNSKLNGLPKEFVKNFFLQTMCERSPSFTILSAVTYFSRYFQSILSKKRWSLLSCVSCKQHVRPNQMEQVHQTILLCKSLILSPKQAKWEEVTAKFINSSIASEPRKSVYLLWIQFQMSRR